MQASSTLPTPEPTLAQPAPVKRLLSLDTLRGFDMFWIIGGEEIFHALAKTTGWAAALFLADQFTHPDWHGFRAYDLIFPLFIFMAGVSTPFSLGSRLEKGASRSELVRKIISRGLLLVLLGIVYNNGLLVKSLAETRFPSVLGRIGLAGMLAQLIYVYSGRRTQYGWFAGILLAYWAVLMLVPVPGCGAGLLTMECNPASYLDRQLLPGHLHKVIHDPEGILSTLPAVCNALLGIFAGNLLRTNGHLLTQNGKVLRLVVAGLGCLLAGWLWNFVFPVNKNLWTSSFVLVTGGLSLLLLALFYWIIDVKGFTRWTLLFTVIGMNSILIYLAGEVIDFEYSARFFFGGLLHLSDSRAVQEVGMTIGLLAVEWAFLYVLYKKKVFLRV
ncbi:acyltransferase family protein [Tellurirhabdus rosea]|uniref:acyltransferase family protein n=1 Tax=Tellurirhabdus rosea TaxID=2674997 RepID=UPI00225B92FA|nr:DUF5009 domain-containing protein [Tellurirhabdus rosea]